MRVKGHKLALKRYSTGASRRAVTRCECGAEVISATFKLGEGWHRQHKAEVLSASPAKAQA